MTMIWREPFTGYDQRAVDFDWKAWVPEVGEIVRFLTREEFFARNAKKGIGPGRNPAVLATWIQPMNHLYGAYAVIKVLGSCHRLSLTGIQVTGRTRFSYSKDMIVPVRALSFREFVKQTREQVTRAGEE